QNVAFVSSDNTSSTNEVNTAYGVSTSYGYNSQREGSSSYTDELMYYFFANQSSGLKLDHEDLKQLDEFDLEEMDLKWQVAMISIRLKKFYKKIRRKLHFDAKEPVGFNKTKVECFNCYNTRYFAREYRSKGNQEKRRDAGNTGHKARNNGRRPRKQDEPKAMVTIDEEGIDWTGHAEDNTKDYALMAFNSSNSGSETEVTSCFTECENTYTKLKKLYDEQREQLGVASIEIQAYTLAFKKVEAQLVCHQKNQLAYEEKIRFMKIDLDDKTNVLIYHKKLLAEAKKEKEELKTKLEIFQSSSKGLSKLLNSQVSAKDKSGLGYGTQIHKGVLSYENEVLESVFDSRPNDIEDSPMNDIFAKVEGMHASKTSESDAKSSDFVSCESNSSVETLEYMPKLIESKTKAASEPKVWSNAPIIEEYESDSDDENVSKAIVEQEIPSCASINTVKHVKSPRQIVKDQNTCSQNPKVNKSDWTGLKSKRQGLGYGYTRKACFVCGSFSHLIKDCDFHEKRMAKQVELKKSKNKVTCQRNDRPVWNNVQRINHKNKFFPTTILTKTGKFLVNAARQNFFSQAASTSTVRKVNTARQIVNDIRPRVNSIKSYAPIRRPFNRTTTTKANFTNHKVNNVGDTTVSAVGGNRETAVKASADPLGRSKSEMAWVPKRNKFLFFNVHDNPRQTLKGKGIVDSGCSRHMTGNKAYLVEYHDFNGGPVAFGGSQGQITGKGKIKTRKLDFDDVYFVKEPQHFNLFFVSQMCDKKNTVFFTDTECLVLSHDFKLPDENQVLLRVHRQHNMYSFNLENIIPSRGLTCLIAKATVDESNKWHRRLGHVNCKNLNKLVKGNLPVTLENKANKTVGPKKANNSAGTQDNLEAGNSQMEAEHILEYFVLPLWFSYTLTVKCSTTKNGDEKLNEDTGAARASSTNYVNTVSTLVNTASTLVNTASIPVKTASLSRNVNATGPSSPDLLTYTNQDDYQIPSLKDIYAVPNDGIFTSASYDAEGVVADFTNLESFVNVSPIPQSRIHSIHPTTQVLDKIITKISSTACLLAFFLRLNLRRSPKLLKMKVSTLIKTKKPLVKDEEAADVDVYLYRSMIGSLMYLIASRPDIMYAVCACSRFQVTLKTLHLHVMKRIFRYLKGQPKLGIWYPKELAFDLEAYSDSDYAGANLDSKSTT
nr:ribonuclease H-like domain-containing protein [Tanacetum cinerariifolium]